MFDGPIVDVAIGLIFFYVVLSLICSAVQELVASVLGLRAGNLEKGIHNLLGDEYANKVYKHPLIKHLARHGKKPSYVRPSIFAAALLDVVGRREDEDGATALNSDQVYAALEKVDRKEPVRGVLLALSRGNDESLDEMRSVVADWYDEAMDRVAGWYKRRVKGILLIIAAFVTVAVNADSLRIAEQLWYDDALRAAAVEAAELHVEERLENRQDESNEGDQAGEEEGPNEQAEITVVREVLEKLKSALATFPIGYPEGFCVDDVKPSMIIGWLLTIGAISLGAPFWFDLLGKVAHLRGSGTREADRARKPGPAPPATPAAPGTPNAEGVRRR